MKEIKLVIFDFDGVLADTYDLYHRFLMEKFRLSDKRAKHFLDKSAVSMRRERRIKWLVRRLESYYYRRFRKYIKEKHDLYRAELPELLDRLTIPAGVVTRSTAKVCEEILDSQYERFEFVYGRMMFHHKHEVIKILMEERGLHEHEVIFVTDTTADILDVQEALPLSQIIVTSWGFSQVEDLKTHIPEEQILQDSLLEIFEKIES
jgi:phosphoglycolate phosphatase-like HAD superfamily hydrolase